MKSFLAFLYICRKQEIMVYKTNRKEDTRLELIVNEFLDDYFLSKEFDATRWVVEKEEQLSGVDIYLTSEKHGLNEAPLNFPSSGTGAERRRAGSLTIAWKRNIIFCFTPGVRSIIRI